MIDRSRLHAFEKKYSENEFVIPSDPIVMKKRFKQEIFKFYLDSLKKGQRILDLNPGFEGIYKENDFSRLKYLSLEQNPKIRAFLEQQNISVKNWTIPHIPLDDSSVDYVLSAAFIEHLPTYIDALNLLIEIRRVLKPNGKILIIVPNYFNLKEIFFDDYKHGWVTTKRRLIDMLSNYQFKICECRYTIGWITMRMNPLTSTVRFIISIIFSILRLNFVDRFLEAIKMDTLSFKFKKTVFELVVIEAEVKKDLE